MNIDLLNSWSWDIDDCGKYVDEFFVEALGCSVVVFSDDMWGYLPEWLDWFDGVVYKSSEFQMLVDKKLSSSLWKKVHDKKTKMMLQHV